MKIQFELDGIDTQDLVAIFSTSITMPWVGFDPGVNKEARLEGNGMIWRTYWSSFTYTVLTEKTVYSASVEYEGAWKGFLAQNLIPSQLRGKTTAARVVEGSTLLRHPGVAFECTCARTLAKAYGIMGEVNPSPLALQDVITVVEVSSHLDHLVKKMNVIYGASAQAETHNGRPAVVLYIYFHGEGQRKLVFTLHEGEDFFPIVARVTERLRRLLAGGKIKTRKPGTNKKVYGRPQG